MSRILIVCALVGILSVPAKADETVKWRHVQYTAAQQTMTVANNGHTLALFRLAGLALFPDGSIGTSSVIGTSDAVIGISSTATGYYTVSFPDGSELWLKFSGETKVVPANKFVNKGTAIVIGGKGRFVGATGEGTYEGQATQPGVAGDSTIGYIDNVINVKK